jgi:hypothetical protein
MTTLTYKVTGRPDTKILEQADEDVTYTYPPIFLFYSIDGTMVPYEVYEYGWAED